MSEEYGSYAYYCDAESYDCEGYYFDGDCYYGEGDDYACYGLICSGEFNMDEFEEKEGDEDAYACQMAAYGADDEYGYWGFFWDTENDHGYGYVCAETFEDCTGYYVDIDSWEEVEEGLWEGAGTYCEGNINYYDEETWDADYECVPYNVTYDEDKGEYDTEYCKDGWCYDKAMNELGEEITNSYYPDEPVGDEDFAGGAKET